MCDVTSSGESCLGSCDKGHSGDIAAVCAYGVYTVSGTCEPGTTMLCVTDGKAYMRPSRQCILLHKQGLPQAVWFVANSIVALFCALPQSALPV